MAADATVTMRYNADTAPAMSGLNSLGSVIKKIGSLMGVAFSVQYIKQFANESIDAYNAQIEAETKLETVMKQRMNATDSQIQSVKDLTAAQQELGVIGDEVQLSGAQQLATFLDNTDAVETLIPAMNNLAAQQDGVNATSESMVNIANMMGKVLDGNTGALTRVGISFTEAQKEALKYGDESERAATLAQVITDNVGDMNAELAKTDAGEIQQAKNEIGDMQEEIGQKMIPIQLDWVQIQRDMLIPLMAKLMEGIAVAASGVIALASGFQKGGTTGKVLAGVFTGLAAAVGAYGAIQVLANASSVNSARIAVTEAKALLSGATSAAAKASANAILTASEKALAEAQAATATASKMMNVGLIALIATVAIMVINAGEMSTGMKILTTVLLAITAVILALKITAWITSGGLAALGSSFLAVIAPATASGVAMTLALGPVGIAVMAVVAAIAALIAIFAIFGGKTEVQKQTEETTKAMKEEREEMDKTIQGYDDTAAASKVAAKSLVDLSKKFKTGEATISQMQSQVDALNDALGEDVVSIDDATGAIKIYGKEVDNAQDVLDGLIDLQNAQSKVSEYQGKLNDALAKKEEAQLMLKKHEEEGYELTNGEIKAYNEQIKEAQLNIDAYTGVLDDANRVIDEQTQKMNELNLQAAQNMTEDEKRQAIQEQLNSDRELSTQEHYDKLQEMMSSNYADLGLTEEEYISQMAEHQQAIEDATEEHQQKIEEATQQHVDTLFAINEEGLYNEAQSVEKLDEIWSKNREDMANYYSNLDALSEAGFDDLATVFDKGGVEMGGSLQNVMDGLQGISLDGWREIQADWNANGGKLSDGMKEKYGKINVQAGLDVLKLADTTKKGFEDAAQYGVDEVGALVDGVETTYEDVNTATETGGETVAQTSAQAGEDAVQSFTSAVKDNMGDVETIGKLTGTSWMTSVIAGINAMRSSLRAKVSSIANSLKISASISASSSRVSVSTSVPHYATGGLVYGPQLAMVGDNPNARTDPELIAPVSKLKAIITNQLEALVQSAIPSLGGNAATYNYYNDNKTDNRQEGPLVNIENYNQNSNQDQQNLVQKIEIARRERALAVGAKI